jgi:hypothetical protein
MIAIIQNVMFGSYRTVRGHRRRTLPSLCVLARLCFCLSILLHIQSYVPSVESVVEPSKTRSEEVILTAHTSVEFTMVRARMTFRTLLKAGRSSQLDSSALQSEPVIDFPSTACFSAIEILGNFRSQLFILSAPGRSPPLS